MVGLGLFVCSDLKLFSGLLHGLFLWRLKAEGLRVLQLEPRGCVCADSAAYSTHTHFSWFLLNC